MVGRKVERWGGASVVNETSDEPDNLWLSVPADSWDFGTSHWIS